MNGFTMAHSTDANIAYSSPFSCLYHSDFFPKVRKDTLFCREIISEAGKLNAGKGEIRDKREMDQKREEADMYLFRHGIT